jgi:hypothetical protein
MTIEDLRARVARRQADLLESAERCQREAGQPATAKVMADSFRQTARDLRRRAGQTGRILEILRAPASPAAMAAALQAQRRTLLETAGRLPPKRSYGQARRRFRVAADDCAEALALLRTVAP